MTETHLHFTYLLPNECQLIQYFNTQDYRTEDRKNTVGPTYAQQLLWEIIQIINEWLDQFLTWYRTKEVQTSFVLRRWPRESLDKDWSTSWQESKEWLDDVSELSIAPLIMQTHECCQRHAHQVHSNAVGTFQYYKPRL